MAAEETLARPVQLADTPAAGIPIQAPLANEIGPLSAKTAWDANDLESFDNSFPIALVRAGAIFETELFLFGPNGDFGLFVAISVVPPATMKARA